MNEAFRWISPLGISVALFLAIGMLWLAIGTLAVPFLNRSTGRKIIFVSNATDTAYFDGSPSELLVPGSALYKLRTLLITVISGFLILAGILYITIAWFGLRQAQSWALISLSVSGGISMGFWALALSPYIRSGIRLTIGDIPPFMWIPAVLIVPATILGFLGWA